MRYEAIKFEDSSCEFLEFLFFGWLVIGLFILRWVIG